MAFQQSAQQAAQRIARPDLGGQTASAAGGPQEQHQQQQQQQQQQQAELSPTWVLFSPPTEVTATSYLTETERSVQTPGRSRLSDLGSLHTGVEAAAFSSAVLLSDEAGHLADESLADDTELDSLDGHLPGFRSLPSRNQHIFPSHDGLGSFRLDQPTLGPDAQDHIYEFEAFNPRRLVRRGLDGFERAQLEIEETRLQEVEKRQRIEDWRLEHGRILLEEIQRETRCRQRLRASLRRTQQSRRAEAVDAETGSDDMDWHDQEGTLERNEEDADAGHSLLARLTRAALRELLGIDERLLSILLGESFLEEEEEGGGDHLDNGEEMRSTARPRAVPSPSAHSEAGPSEPWQTQILERVSRELGLLVDQLTRYPGAFSTYDRAQQTPLPFAGLPVIPETAPDGQAATGSATPTQTTASMADEGMLEADLYADFRPTVLPAPPAGRGLGGMSRKSSESDGTSRRDASATAMGGVGSFTQEEWERDMDIKLVFRYLVSRFTTSRSDSFVSAAECPRHNVSKPQDAVAKAARMRHHPLISRTRPAERRASFKAAAGGGGSMAGPAAAATSAGVIRHPSSCASQSTRRSARRSSGSSRHYWDMGGSIKTGSAIASNGAMGTWAEG